jgi:Trk-type K+ transport system membrane component
MVKVMKSLLARTWVLRLLVIFVLSITEHRLMNRASKEVNLWYIMFEMISAYCKEL